MLESKSTINVNYDLSVNNDVQEGSVIESNTTLTSNNIAEVKLERSLVVGSSPFLNSKIELNDLNGGKIEVGDKVEYVINIENTGTSAASNLNIENIIPSALEYISGTGTINGSLLADNDGDLVLENRYNLWFFKSR
ncbi:MAG: DUF11 domain-containing protein [Halanaerobiales bacterium]|nr:DUF11 domain-containing protein [Halanaerobiales bacterium]